MTAEALKLENERIIKMSNKIKPTLSSPVLAALQDVAWFTVGFEDAGGGVADFLERNY